MFPHTVVVDIYCYQEIGSAYTYQKGLTLYSAKRIKFVEVSSICFRLLAGPYDAIAFNAVVLWSHHHNGSNQCATGEGTGG